MALGRWRQVRAQMATGCQGRGGMGGGENVQSWEGAEVFQVAGVERIVKLVAERAVALAGRMDGAELILKYGRYGKQWTNGPGGEGATEERQQWMGRKTRGRLKWHV